MRQLFAPFFLICCSVYFAGCSSASQTAPPVNVQASEIEDAERQLTRHLVDPESANFRNATVYNTADNRAGVVCGEVNSKNRSGGYTDYQRFFSGAKGLVGVEQPTSGPSQKQLFDAQYSALCQRYATAEQRRVALDEAGRVVEQSGQTDELSTKIDHHKKAK